MAYAGNKIPINSIWLKLTLKSIYRVFVYLFLQINRQFKRSIL
ncbi:hypothetical protein XNC1_2354 [Xenorhabdus nematophila ATCC 19061]|uniref:Uncharacterized protein n=1 Tax=Xenorhabdus nematophila (strain ATCC 19061 / DSM 3370 / CCUG 14189 / LMG 1036 / NCIMB 9965 / AN6) TaxID=406817 RepID=D3VGH7_XENNA|nr:hypothetical protein XNC1_2354 [Xenorhabdus nematophila ATCC 19061]